MAFLKGHHRRCSKHPQTSEDSSSAVVAPFRPSASSDHDGKHCDQQSRQAARAPHVFFFLISSRGEKSEREIDG